MISVFSSHQHPALRRGFGLVDSLIGVAVVSIVFAAALSVIRLNFVFISEGKARTGALFLAQEKIESIRALPYASVGVAGGAPSGSVVSPESISLNGISYTRETTIAYADDPHDGQGGSDDEDDDGSGSGGVADDYKKAKVTVRWTTRNSEKSLSFFTNVAP